MADYNTRLGTSESGGNYGIVNSEGYGGKYQWGEALLQDYNNATGQNLTMTQFLASPAIQEQAQDWSNARTDKALAQYVGATVNGQTLDRDSLRAMAHLGGIGGATKYVTSGGAYNPSDSNGTSLSDYAQKFSGTGSYTAAQNDATYPTGTAVNALASVPTQNERTMNKLAEIRLIQSLFPTQTNALSTYKMT